MKAFCISSILKNIKSLRVVVNTMDGYSNYAACELVKVKIVEILKSQGIGVVKDDAAYDGLIKCEIGSASNEVGLQINGYVGKFISLDTIVQLSVISCSPEFNQTELGIVWHCLYHASATAASILDQTVEHAASTLTRKLIDDLKHSK